MGRCGLQILGLLQFVQFESGTTQDFIALFILLFLFQIFTSPHSGFILS